MTKSLEVQNSYIIKKISFTMKGRNVTLLGTLIYLKVGLCRTLVTIYIHTQGTRIEASCLMFGEYLRFC